MKQQTHGKHNMQGYPPRLKKPYKRVIQLELNEISKAAIDHLIIQGKLPHFRKINESWTYYQTTSEKRYEHLEPWIQWTTAHTGKTFEQHSIFHLSDAEQLKHPQIWETLNQHGIESCVVGSMNTIRGKCNNGFFFPDPWSKDGKTHPPETQPLWDLISKKVQSHATAPIKMKDLIQGFNICRHFKLPIRLYTQIVRQLIYQKVSPKNRWRLAGLFDLFLTEIFKHLFNSEKYQYHTLFLNSVAHYQHHYWRNFQPELFNSEIAAPGCLAQHDPMTHGYEILDRILGHILKLQSPDTLIIVASGLSQEPFTKEEDNHGMSYYRLYNHTLLLKKLGLANCQALPLMSRDWQVETDEQETLHRAEKALSQVAINGENLFKVTRNSENTLFIETAITHTMTKNAEVIGPNGKSIGTFGQYLHKTAVKSGSHISEGSLWISEAPQDKHQATQKIPLTSLYNLNLSAMGIHEPTEKTPDNKDNAAY